MKKKLHVHKGFNSLTTLVQPQKWFVFLSPEFISNDMRNEPQYLAHTQDWAVGNSKINVAGDYPDLSGIQSRLQRSGFASMDKTCALGCEPMTLFHNN